MHVCVCVSVSSGEYSCLKAEFHLQRSMGYHLVQSYLPTVLIVVISWVSFWLDVEAIPARITLGVTTLLTISSKVRSPHVALIIINNNDNVMSSILGAIYYQGTAVRHLFC